MGNQAAAGALLALVVYVILRNTTINWRRAGCLPHLDGELWVSALGVDRDRARAGAGPTITDSQWSRTGCLGIRFPRWLKFWYFRPDGEARRATILLAFEGAQRLSGLSPSAFAKAIQRAAGEYDPSHPSALSLLVAASLAAAPVGVLLGEPPIGLALQEMLERVQRLER